MLLDPLRVLYPLPHSPERPSPCSTVRIWDYTQDACINVLSGHSAPVRGLLWNTEVPYLLTSGMQS